MRTDVGQALLDAWERQADIEFQNLLHRHVGIIPRQPVSDISPILPRRTEMDWHIDNGPKIPAVASEEQRLFELKKIESERRACAETTSGLVDGLNHRRRRRSGRSLTIGRYRLVDLCDGQCRYPTSEAPYLFCGAPAGRSYCDEHSMICSSVRVRR